MSNHNVCVYDTYETVVTSFMMVIAFFTVGVGITFLNRVLDEETDFRITCMKNEIANLRILNEELEHKLEVQESEEGYDPSDSYEEEKTD